jgi:hypothetical protein
MASRLLNLGVQKRPETVRFAGRVLFLTEDPKLIKRQLAGEDLRAPLRTGSCPQ